MERTRIQLKILQILQENAAVLSYIVSQPKTDEIDVFWLGLSETWGNDKWTNT